jgi:hypothetical protein
VRDLCDWYLTRLLAAPEFRVGLLAVAMAEGDPVISEAISGRHRENSPRWMRFYKELLRARGLRMRSGVTVEDCEILLAAVADGLALRALADPGAPVADGVRWRRLLGTAALALMAGCLERAGHSDGRSLAEAVRAMMSGPSGGSGRKQA